MHIETTREKILNASLLCERISGKRESLPVLSCILLDAQKEMSVRATNLEAGIDVRVAANITESGTVAVPATVLTQTLRSMGREKITLRTDENNLVLESQGTKTLIKAISHNEFPNISMVSEQSSGVSVQRARILEGIQSVSYAASQSMIRPELGSVYMSIKNGKLVCVATDSFRLAEKTIVQKTGDTESDLLIPLKHAIELTHVLERIQSDEVLLRADDSQISIEGEGVRFVSRVIDASFPNYKEIIPKTFATEATVLKNDLAEMLRKARVFSGNDQHVGLHLYPKRKVFTATAQSPDVGEMSDSIDAALEGDDLDINFHIGYLADCLSSIASDSIVLKFAGPGRPLVVSGISDGNFMYLVMPLNR